MESQAWFADLDLDDGVAVEGRIRTGSADAPEDWPAEAVAAGVVDDEAAYYDRLHEATMAATREAVAERERADDQQLVHAVRAIDDLAETANDLTTRVTEWAGSYYGETGSGAEYVAEVADREPDGPVETRVVSIARRVRDLRRERTDLEDFVDRQARSVCPNLAMLAGPLLAARLVALAGGLESLAKKPSGTLQVLGAEDALFAHLRGQAPSPKHGVIYTHEYVRGTRPEDRGSAARALAGKLSIAARIDHYSGDRRPDLADELDERIARIRARADEGTSTEEGDG
ncbi:MAG: NOP5/NOP56 family protein [Halanaeroarchaeum sp.]